MARLASITLRVTWIYSVCSLRPRWALRRFGDKPDRFRPESAVAKLLKQSANSSRAVPINRHWFDRGGDRQGGAPAVSVKQ